MTEIEWTDETWNPVTGCSRVSTGCDHCYAMRQARRFDGLGHGYDGTTRNEDGVDWTGVVHTHEDRLEEPLSWQKPRRVFVCSMSDLFHPSVPFEFIDKVFGVMALATDHTFQILTKRPGRMREYFDSVIDCHAKTKTRGGPWKAKRTGFRVVNWAVAMNDGRIYWNPQTGCDWPLPNVWLGTSVENQKPADERIPQLIKTPATVHFLSCEPLLGPVDLSEWIGTSNGTVTMSAEPSVPKGSTMTIRKKLLDWVIVGGESGPDARPMHPDWVREVRARCGEADVPFFFKQWGAWAPLRDSQITSASDAAETTEVVQTSRPDQTSRITLCRLDKKKAGRELDGCTHDAFPEPEEVTA